MADTAQYIAPTELAAPDSRRTMNKAPDSTRNCINDNEVQREPPVDHRPIGVFDSGVGGLSVLAEIHRELPHEDLIYVADSGHAPYGDKPRAEIEARSFAIADFLLANDAKALVIACNTATGAAARQMRERLKVPLIAMEPAVKPAVALTRSGVVGVLATSQTLASNNFVKLMGRFGGGANVLVQPCPGLADRVEQGAIACAVTRDLVSRYVKPLVSEGCDTLVLGCTHYPHLRELIQEVAGHRVRVLDSGAGVARQVRRRLHEHGLMNHEDRLGATRYVTTGDRGHLHEMVAALLGHRVDVDLA